MPPHLQLTLLNVPPALDAQAVLPRPQHVILNHVYCQRGQVGATTHMCRHLVGLHALCAATRGHVLHEERMWLWRAQEAGHPACMPRHL